jgi:competence protein ComEC
MSRRRARAALDAAAGVVASHPRHRLLFGLVAGLLLGPVSRPAAAVAALAAAAFAGLAARLAAGPRPRGGASPVLVGFALAAAVLAGGILGSARLAALEAGVLPHLEGRVVAARAVLLEPVHERAAGPAVARVRLLDAPAAGEQAVLRIRSAPPRGGWPGVGEIAGLRGEIAPLGRFDAYQRRRGAFAAIDAFALWRTGARRGGLAGVLDGARRRAESGLERGLHAPEAALLRGMVLGQDERISDAVRTDFQRSGLAHILAVSGQNVMLLATLVLAAGALTGLGLRARLLLALALIAVYVPLAGAGPSIQRAGVMGAAGLAATLAGRPASRWYAVGLAAAVTLALNPLAAGDPGWQLSFAAVVALLALGPPLRAVLSRRLPGPLADVAAITIAATLGTAPLMAFHFERVSIVSLPANLLAAAAIAPVMWLGMLAAAAAQIAPVLALPFTLPCAPLLAFIAAVAHAAAAAPAAVATAHLGSPAALALAYAVLGAAAAATARLWRTLNARGAAGRLLGSRRGASARPLAALATLLAVAAGGVAVARARAGPAPPRPGELVVSFLDVGQGDATLLQLDGRSALFDTGPPDGPILARLGAAGVRRLDVLVLTHAQADHEGAAPAVIARFRPRAILDGGAGWPSTVQRALPAAAAATASRALAAHAGQVLRLGRLRLRLLWPPLPGPGWRPDGDANLRAVVALASYGSFDLLLPADAESDVTLPLGLPHVEALKVAHHGSADEGLPLQLRQLTPRVAVIEVGRGNTYGHPTAQAMAALRAVPHVLRTDRDGTVRLHVRGGAMTIERLGPGR